MHLDAHSPHDEDLTSLFPIVVDESELTVYTEDDLDGDPDTDTDLEPEAPEPVDRAPQKRTSSIAFRSATLEGAAWRVDATAPEEIDLSTQLEKERDPDPDDDCDDVDDVDEVVPLPPRRLLTLTERARELASRFAMRVLVPVIAIALLVIAMGGTWTTAGATPVNPWSATISPGARGATSTTRTSSRTSGSAASATSSADVRTTAAAAEPANAVRPAKAANPSTGEKPQNGDSGDGPVTPIYRAKSGHGVLSGKLNLNTASEDQLMLLPTVGPAKAERIVTWRKMNGGFKRTADLRRVKGFGYKTYKKLEPFLDTKGDTTLVPK